MATPRIVPPFVPTWGRGRDTRYHARSLASETLGDAIRADLRLLRLSTDGGSLRTLAAIGAAEE